MHLVRFEKPAVWIVAISLASNSVSAAESTIFMFRRGEMTSGAERWLSPNADGSDGPVATVERAQKLVRKLRVAQPELKRPLVVSLRGGSYELAATLRFSASDGGSVSSPTRYQAYENEMPVMSGGRVIDGWEVGADGRWRVTLEKVASGEWEFSQLFVNDQRRFRPNSAARGLLSRGRIAFAVSGGRRQGL